ncbi:MAG: 2-C-methyl-D-erythritol 4-phosphate cytidylyltransferase, partial [Ktedonobacterales bacterium]|nr:2-C-methyl-D-erythritol 4-phosphate cytidylyltransferase [Ktedonobacterales bacterium]
MESWADGLVGAVIVAAGPSQRMRGLDKIWAPLLGRPLLAWAAAPFEEVSAIQRIVVVVAPEHLAQAHALCQAEGRRHITAIVPGGPRRRDSVRAGLEALGDGCALAVIHDGARPLLTPALILTGLTAAKRTGAATAATPVKETIKLVR